MRTDPATLEIMRSYFNSIASGMGHVIERTSYTTFVKESADFATALASPEGDFYAYPRSVGVTIFLGLSLKKAIESCGELEPGDILITNDPYTTDGLATHLPDVHIIKPIFHEDKLISYAWAFVHCSDVGGLVPASISPKATDVHQEGLRISPVKLYKRGHLNEDVRLLIEANSRVAHLNYGDINAMVAAVNTAESRLETMIEKFGAEAVTLASQDLLQQGEKRARNVIANIPDGTYSFHDYLDDDMLTDIPVRLAADITIKDSDIKIDFSRCDSQVKSAFNLVTNGSRHSFMLQGLINYIISEDPYIPINAGIIFPVEVNAPTGTIVNPAYPAAVGVRHSITMRLYSVILGALSKALPENVPAAGAGQAAIVVLSTLNKNTGNQNMAVVQPLGGGGGGQSDMDGVDGIDHSSGFLKNTPIESLEQHIDILVHRYELMPGTAGPGFHRGGHSIRLDFEAVRPDSMVTARGMERMRFQPWGINGGRAGISGEVVTNPDTNDEKIEEKINVLTLREGDIVSIRTPSGGGWGNANNRPPHLVKKEVEDGLLSIKAANEIYGVVLEEEATGDFRVDEKATEKTRQLMEDKPGSFWDFGQKREEYEKEWTIEASDELARLLQKIPPSERWYRKKEVHERLVNQKNITRDAVAKIWSEWSEKDEGGNER